MQCDNTRKTLRLSTLTYSTTSQSKIDSEINQRCAKSSASQVCHPEAPPNTILLITVREGVADEQLAQIEQERTQERKSVDDGLSNKIRNRSKSASSYSSTSVSTISTDLSRSASRKRDARYKSPLRPFSDLNTRKGKRSATKSSMSYSSGSSNEGRRGRTKSIGTRRLESRNESSEDRGRSASLERRHAVGRTKDTRKRRRSSSSSMSYMSESSRRKWAKSGDRQTRARRSSTSPNMRGRSRSSYGRRNHRRTRSRSRSADRWRMTGTQRQPISKRDQPRFSENDGRSGARYRGREHGGLIPPRPAQLPPVRKDRSLSPFSKRLALTQAMNSMCK